MLVDIVDIQQHTVPVLCLTVVVVITLKKMTARWKNATKMRCKKCRNVVIEIFGESIVTGHNVKILGLFLIPKSFYTKNLYMIIE